MAEAPSTVDDPTWLDPKTAEAMAKKSGVELWKGQLVIVFGKYAGQTFRWLLEKRCRLAGVVAVPVLPAGRAERAAEVAEGATA